MTQKYKSAAAALAAALFLSAVTAYFLWSALHGEYGWFELADARAHVENMETVQALLERDIAGLHSLIDGLRGPDVDQDLLDERIRAALGRLRPDEVILYE